MKDWLVQSAAFHRLEIKFSSLFWWRRMKDWLVQSAAFHRLEIKFSSLFWWRRMKDWLVQSAAFHRLEIKFSSCGGGWKIDWCRALCSTDLRLSLVHSFGGGGWKIDCFRAYDGPAHRLLLQLWEGGAGGSPLGSTTGGHRQVRHVTKWNVAWELKQCYGSSVWSLRIGIQYLPQCLFISKKQRFGSGPTHHLRRILIRIQDFVNKTWKKQLKKMFVFFDKKLQFRYVLIPRPL